MEHLPTCSISPDAPARTLVALHCSGAGGRAFAPYRTLLDADTVLHAPDLLGYGDGGWNAGMASGLDDEADALAPWLDSDPLGVHLLGHSYGGAVALQLALRWPQRVLSLTLYEPVRFALLADDPRLLADIRGVGSQVVDRARAGDLESSARRFIDYWSQPGAFDSLPPARQLAVAARMPKVAAEFAAISSDALPPSAYAHLPMPVTVLVGGRSPAPAQGVAERLARLCPRASLVRLPHCGHMGALESPDDVVQALPWSRVWAEAA